MTATCSATRTAEPKPARTLSFNPLVGCLHITDGGTEKGYYVDRLGHDLGPAVACYRVSKILPAPGEPASYDVAIGEGEAGDSCECRGWLRWSKCRHVAALRCLRALHKLP